MNELKFTLRLDAETGQLVASVDKSAESVKALDAAQTAQTKTTKAAAEADKQAAAAEAAKTAATNTATRATAEASAKAREKTSAAKQATAADDGQALAAARLATAEARAATAQQQSAVAAQRVATEQQRTAAATARATTERQRAAAASARATSEDSRAALASQRLATEQQRTAAAAAMASSAKDRAAASARNLANATEGASVRAEGLITRLQRLRSVVGVALLLGLTTQFADAGNAALGFQSAMLSATGSMPRARQEIAYVNEEAERIGIVFRDAVPSFAGMAAAARGTSLEGQGVRDIFTAVAEKARVLNLSNEATKGTFIALTQIMGKGKVTAEELRGQLAERLPDAVQIMARAVGVSTAELDKMLEQGTLLAEDALPKFAAELRKSSAASIEMARAAPTAEFARLRNAIYESSAGMANQTGLLNLLAAGARVATAALRALPDLVGQVKASLQQWGDVFASTNASASDFFSDMRAGLGEIGVAIVQAFQWIGGTIRDLPSNLSGAVTIMIGLADKLRITLIEQWQLIGNSSDQVWNSTKAVVSSVIGSIRVLMAEMVDGVLTSTANLVSRIADLARSLGSTQLAAVMDGAVASLRNAATSESEVRQQVEAGAAAYRDRASALERDRSMIELWADEERGRSDAVVASTLAEIEARKAAARETANAERANWAYGKSGEAAAAGDRAATVASKEAEKAAKERAKKLKADAKDLEQSTKAFGTVQEQLSAQLGGAGAKAAEVYANQLERIAEYEMDLARLGPISIENSKAIAKAREDAAEALRREQLQAQYALRGTAALNDEMQREAAAIGQTAEQRELSNRLRAAEQALIEDGIDLNSRHAEIYLDSVRAMQGWIKEQERAAAASQRFADIVKGGASSAIDAFSEFVTRGMRDFRSFRDGIVSIARDMVAAVISEMLKLTAIKFFTGQSSGGWANMLGGALQSMMGGSSAGGGGFNVGGLMSMFGGGSGGGTVSNIASLFGAGGGAVATGGQLAGILGAGGYGGLFASGAGWLGSGAAASGFVGSVSGAGLGSGAYASLALGGTGAAGTNVATGAAASSGAMGGAMAVPIIGWIIAAMMANDALFSQGWRYKGGDESWGGKLATLGMVGLADQFSRNVLGMDERTASLLSGSSVHTALWGRRAPRVTGYRTDFDFGPEGASGTQWTDWKAKGGLFRSDKKGSIEGDLAADMLAQIEAFWESVGDGMQAIGRRFGSKVPQMLEASFAQEFDKKGELVKSVGTIMGRQYEEAWEIFQQRILAENLIAALGATQIGAGASELAEAWRDDAARLLDGAQMMIAAADDIRRGAGLLAEAGNSLTTQGAGGLADVVALVEDLAASGESLTAAYARIYGSAALLDQALALTGVELNRTREEAVRFAVAISDAAGGLDAATGLWNAYFEAFFSAGERASQQLDVLRALSDRALEGIGLDPRTTMAQFREQFAAALPTLSAEDVVTWLEAARALAAVTQAADQMRGEAIALLESLGLATGELSPFRRELLRIRDAERQAIDAANALARARGREGASATQIAAIHTWAAGQIAAAARRLDQEIRDIVAQLYGGIPGSLDAINERIAQLEAANAGVADSLGNVEDAGAQLFASWRNAITSIRDYLDSMLLGDLSALSPAERLAEARRQLEEMAAAAAGGDAGAAANLPGLADVYLRLLRGMEASGSDYGEGFAWVRELLAGIADLPNPGREGSLGSAGGGNTTYVAPSPELIELYNARDALLAEQEAQHRAILAQQLAQNLADMAALTRQPILDMFALYEVSLRELAEDLGIDLRNLTADSVLALGNLATTLGLTLTQLTGELGITLGDLSGGLTELTERVGIDLGALTAASTQALAALAGGLGADLSELAESLGIDLGELVDAQSLLNQALAGEIAGLPQDQRDLLAPLLEAITAATNEADANAAIAALEAAVLGLPPDLRNLLAPYLEGVTPIAAFDDLDYLAGIDESARDNVFATREVRDAIRALGVGMELPGFAVGSPNIPYDMTARVHKGEIIAPAPVSDFLRKAGITVQTTGGDASPAMAEAVRQLLEETRALRLENARLQQLIADRLRDVSEAQDSTAEAIDRQTQEIRKRTA